jgi:2-methylisocitrate lyase-like PEP mutase family enzyme
LRLNYSWSFWRLEAYAATGADVLFVGALESEEQNTRYA